MAQPSVFGIFGFSGDGWGLLLLTGAALTVAVALCGFALGAVLGGLGAWAKIAGGRGARAAAETYTTVLRGIPELLVIYLFYFGGSAAVTAIGQWLGADGFVGIPGFLAGVLAVGFTSGAQQTEVFRGAYHAVARGEIEAAVACGMPRALRLRRIVAPLVLRYALPGLGNVWQTVLKAAALISVTGVADLLRQAQVGAGSTGLPFDFYVVAACAFLAISAVSGWALNVAERFYSRGLRQGR
jgi:octopine/nopaline transport system permease protein